MGHVVPASAASLGGAQGQGHPLDPRLARHFLFRLAEAPDLRPAVLSVPRGVAGEHTFRKDQQLHAPASRLADERDHAVQVTFTSPEVNAWAAPTTCFRGTILSLKQSQAKGSSRPAGAAARSEAKRRRSGMPYTPVPPEAANQVAAPKCYSFFGAPNSPEPSLSIT